MIEEFIAFEWQCVGWEGYNQAWSLRNGGGDIQLYWYIVLERNE